MASIQDLISQQEVRANNIEKVISTIKKAPLERRTEEFYKIKRDELVKLWQGFEKVENTIRRDPTLSEEDPYIVRNFYQTVGEMYNVAIESVEDQIDKLKKKPPPAIKERTTLPIQHVSEDESTKGLARRVIARMTALSRLLQGLSSLEEDHPHQFYIIKSDTIRSLWTQIQELYDEIWQKTEDPSRLGLEQSNFDNLEDLVQHCLIQLTVLAEKQHKVVTGTPLNGSSLATSSPLPLPKVTIPHFNGDYANWRQFYELFIEMVDKQPLPNVQKMWYLKNTLSGEAGKLISHLALSEENYKTAWMLLQERYNNKRVLVATLVEKILSQPKGASSTYSIKTLHDTTKECLLALNNLDIDTSTWDAIIVQLMMKKLDYNLYVRFIQSLAKPKEVPTVKEFLLFLEMQFEAMESIAQKERSNSHQKPNRAVTSVTSMQNDNCKLCNNGRHLIYQCKRFLAMAEAERLKWIQQQKWCVNCFKTDHMAKACTHGCCKKCNNKHNTLLHLPKGQMGTRRTATSSDQVETARPTTQAPVNAVAVSSASVNSSTKDHNYVMLATAKVIIKAANGMSREFRAILDSGSQVNIVTERLIRKLSLAKTESSLCIDGVGTIQRKASHRATMEMMSINSDFSTTLEAFVLPTIIPAQPSSNIDIAAWKIPNNIRLADPKFHLQGNIDILLGAEFYFSLTQPGTIKLGDNNPVLQNTSLGWIVGGSIKHTKVLPSEPLTCAIFDSESSLEQAIEKLWKLDDIESSEKNLSPAEKLCEEHFKLHVQNNVNGRFVVSLPFRENPVALGKSYQMAYNRFISLEQRLQKNEDIRVQYVQFMKEYEQLGHMEKVQIDTIPNPKYFIPHHCVLKPDSTTTKLRVVFDASAKTSTGLSLNDIMYAGPTVQSELFSILLRFRMPKFVFTADIEKMYRQIAINPDNYQYQLIIWRKTPSSPISYYRLNTVTYGTRAAPYLATKCLQRIAEENADRYPLGARMLKENFYVDDGLGGSDSLQVALEIQKELITILDKHGFRLRKWCSNSPKLLKDIPHDDQILNLDLSDNTNKSIKTLGLHWVPQTDQFCIKVNLTEYPTVSKRTVTSELAKLFDPLGLLAPVIVQAKIFIQQLWQHTLDWDEPLSQDLRTVWNDFRDELKTLENFKIKRHIFFDEVPVTTQLHVFADASERAFGAAAYIRATLKDGRVSVRLLCAKSRVAPLKQQTLPRLELCAAVVAAQLAHKVNAECNRKIHQTFLWTDSEIVLSWINSQSSSYKTFVANRVSTIQSLTLAGQWRHVKSKDNPADVLSRGLQPSKLPTNGLWFHGPMFLHGNESLWPSSFAPQPLKADNPELKKVVMATTITQNYDLIYTINHKNSFGTLQRIMAYVIRFTRNSRITARDRPTHISLTPKELDDSLHLIVRAIQFLDFAEEIRQLQRNQTIDKKSPLNSLSPILDKEGVIRVGGRLKNSELPPDTMHPMILPYNDSLAKLLFIMIHQNNKHCGPQALLTIVR